MSTKLKHVEQIKLIGPKCSELKVRDAGSRFHWNPRNLTGQIIQIYINLYGDELAEAMVEDEVLKYFFVLFLFVRLLGKHDVYLAFIYT